MPIRITIETLDDRGIPQDAHRLTGHAQKDERITWDALLGQTLARTLTAALAGKPIAPALCSFLHNLSDENFIEPARELADAYRRWSGENDLAGCISVVIDEAALTGAEPPLPERHDAGRLA